MAQVYWLTLGAQASAITIRLVIEAMVRTLNATASSRASPASKPIAFPFLRKGEGREGKDKQLLIGEEIGPTNRPKKKKKKKKDRQPR